MTKQDFVDAVADRAGISKRDAGEAVDAVLDTITDTLKAGDAVTFTGFGKFSTSAARGAYGRQPAHGRAGSDPGDDRAEVHGRECAQDAVNVEGRRETPLVGADVGTRARCDGAVARGVARGRVSGSLRALPRSSACS